MNGIGETVLSLALPCRWLFRLLSLVSFSFSISLFFSHSHQFNKLKDLHLASCVYWLWTMDYCKIVLFIIFRCIVSIGFWLEPRIFLFFYLQNFVGNLPNFIACSQLLDLISCIFFQEETKICITSWINIDDHYQRPNQIPHRKSKDSESLMNEVQIWIERNFWSHYFQPGYTKALSDLDYWHYNKKLSLYQTFQREIFRLFFWS